MMEVDRVGLRLEMRDEAEAVGCARGVTGTPPSLVERLQQTSRPWLWVGQLYYYDRLSEPHPTYPPPTRQEPHVA